VTLSQEERLKRERERWRQNKAKRRRQSEDAAWQRVNEGGYIERIEVFHWKCFLEVLVNDDWLDEENIHSSAHISGAVDHLLTHPDLSGDPNNGYNRRRRPFGDSPGAVRVRITPELLDECQRQGCGDRRAVKIFIEDHIRRYYLTHIDNPP